MWTVPWKRLVGCVLGVALACHTWAQELKPVERPGYLSLEQTDDADPELLTAEELLSSRDQPVDGLLPLLDREPVHQARDFLDAMESYIEDSLDLRLTPEVTIIYQAGTHGGSENMSALFNLDVPLLWMPIDSDEWYGGGSLGFLYRHRDEYIGTTPRELSDSLGVNALLNDTGVGGNAFNALLQLWWEQAFFNDQFIVRLGRVDQGAYLDGNRYAGSDKRYFLAEPLATGGPNRRFPSEGFGFNLVYDPDDAPIYLAFGLHDANARNTRTGFDTIGEGDLFFGGQVAWTPEYEGLGKGFYRFTASAMQDNPTSGESWSFMLSFDQDVDDLGLGTFFRYGVSDGLILTLDQQMSTGVAFLSPFGFKDDRAGVGVFWFGVDHASENDLGFETFYRFQVAKRVQFTPDVQLILPHEDDREVEAVFSLRLRAFF